jgi:hypothetical protein
MESGATTAIRGHNLKKLAKALGVEDFDLLQKTANIERLGPIVTDEQNGFGKSTNNSLLLLSERYKISPQEIMEAAPLLFFIAAEQSLHDREEHVTELRAAAERLRELQVRTPYLAQSLAVDEADLRREELSIQDRDLFGFKLRDEDNEFRSVEDQEGDINPFIVYLRGALEKASPATPRDTLSLYWDTHQNQRGELNFSICREEAAALVGGDDTATQAILLGSVALSEMPMDVSPEERAQWVRNALDLTPADVNDEASDDTPEPLTDDDDDIDDDNGDWETPDRGAIH